MLFNVLLGYLVTKINTEYLTLTEFGMYNLFVNTISLISVFFSFGLFETTSKIVAAEENSIKAKEFFGATVVLTVIIGLALNIAVLLISLFFDTIFEIKIGFLLFLFWPLVFPILIQTMLQTTLRGFNYTGLLSVFTVTPRLLYLSSLLLLIFCGVFTLRNTILGYLVTLLLSSVLIMVFIKPRFQHLKECIFSISSGIKSFGSHLYLANIFSIFSIHADKLILAYFLDARQMAYYALAYTLTAPIPYFSNALATSAFKKFATYERIPKRHLAINFGFIFLIAFLLILYHNLIINQFFSRDFSPAIPSFIILTFAFSLTALSVPYTMFFKAQGRGKEVRNITIIVQTLFLILDFILIPVFGIIGAASAAFIGYLIDYLLYLAKYHRLFKK